MNPNLEEDPYNLEEIASQLIDEDEPKKQTQGTSGSQKTQTSELDLKDKSPEGGEIANHSSFPREETDSSKDASEEMESKGANDDDDILYELDNSELCLSGDDDFIEKEISSIKSFCVDTECMDSPLTSVARKCVSFKLSPSSDQEERESKKLTNNFTSLKEKTSASFMNMPSSSAEESCDVIPPTSSLNGVKSRIARKDCVEDSDGERASSDKEDQSFYLNNSCDKSSSSEDDSDEGLFSRQKQSQPVFRTKRKPAVAIPFTEARKAAFKEGQRRFRRYSEICTKRTPLGHSLVSA